MAEVTPLFPNALSPRPRGRVDEKTDPGDAPEEREAYPSGYEGWEQCKCDFYPYAKRYMFPDQPYLTRIKEIVLAGLADIPCTVYLFGSRAEGTHTPTSDVDIAVLAEKDISRQLCRIRERLEDSTIPLVVDLVDLRYTTPAFFQQVQTQGIVIWKN